VTLKDTLAVIGREVIRQQADPASPAMRSPAEGYGVLLMGQADLWGTVRSGEGDGPEAREQAIAVAAAAVRYAMEVADTADPADGR